MIKKVLFLTLMFIGVIQLHAQEKTDNAKNQPVTYITCKIENGLKHDTLSLVLNGPFFNYYIQQVPEHYSPQTLTAVADDNGVAKFKLLTENAPFHVTLFLSSRRNEAGYLIGKGEMSNYLIMPGDNININLDGDKRTFTGKGAEHFEAQYEIEGTDKDQRILKRDQYGYLRSDPEVWLKEKDSLLKVQLVLLASYQSKIPPLAYSIIRADIIGLNRGSVYEAISHTPLFMAAARSLTEKLADVYEQLEKSPDYINLNDRACLSPKYVYYLYEKLKLEVKYDHNNEKTDPYSDENYFPQIRKGFKGMLRDKLLARWIIEVASVNDLQPEYAADALAVMQTLSFINIVDRLKIAYQKGQQVTDFGFKNSKGRTVHLADFKGKIVVADMWFTGCGECRLVAARMRYVEKQFKDRSDVVFISISIDRNRNMWLKSINEKDGKNYVTRATTYLYTAGTGDKNPFIEKYVPDGGYPTLLIIGEKGKIFSATLPHPVNEEAQEEFVKQINAALTSKS